MVNAICWFILSSINVKEEWEKKRVPDSVNLWKSYIMSIYSNLKHYVVVVVFSGIECIIRSIWYSKCWNDNRFYSKYLYKMNRIVLSIANCLWSANQRSWHHENKFKPNNWKKSRAKKGRGKQKLVCKSLTTHIFHFLREKWTKKYLYLHRHHHRHVHIYVYRQMLLLLFLFSRYNKYSAIILTYKYQRCRCMSGCSLDSFYRKC